MSIYRLSLSTLSRSDNKSAVAASCYRVGELGAPMFDERRQVTHDYTRKGNVERVGLVGWAGTREQLWNRAEAAERRKDSQIAREVQVALPRELGEAARWRLTMHAARYLNQTFGVAVDAAMHRPMGRDRRPQPHAHLLFTTRRVSAEGELGEKTRELNDKRTSAAHVEQMRAMWAKAVNAELAAAKVQARVDHRSYRRRGEQRESTNTPRGAVALERRGVSTERGAAAWTTAQANAGHAVRAAIPRALPPTRVPPEVERLAVDLAAVEQERDEQQARRATRRQEQEARRLAAIRKQQREQQPAPPSVAAVPATGEQSPTPSEHSPALPIVQQPEAPATDHRAYHTPPTKQRRP